MSSHFNIKGSQYKIPNFKYRNVPVLTVFFCFCITSTCRPTIFVVFYIKAYLSIEQNLGIDCICSLNSYIYIEKIFISMINNFSLDIFFKKKIRLTYVLDDPDIKPRY